jgi:4-amino-4-deoxy-L-arabinose transferase-like glycosyltransferase
VSDSARLVYSPYPPALRRRDVQADDGRRRLWMEWLGVALLLLLAAAIRQPFFDTIPRFTDETLDNEVSYAIYRGWGMPLHAHESYIGSLHNYFEAAGFLISGGNPLAPRGVALLFGVFAVGATYLLARELLARPAAFMAAAFLATSGVHVAFSSHVAYSHSTSPLYLALGLAFLLRAVRLQSGPALAVAGLACGIALQSHPTIAAFLPGAGVFLLWKGRALLCTRWTIAAASLFLLGYSNLIVYNLATGFDSVTSAPHGVFGGAGVRLDIVRESLGVLARLVSGAVDARSSFMAYLADPLLLTYSGLSLVGLILLVRAGSPLPALVTGSVLLLLPFFGTDSSVYDVPPNQGRYLTPLLPVLVTGLAASVWSLRRASRWASTRRAWALSNPRWLGPLVTACLVLLPLISLTRYYRQNLDLGRTNQQYFRVLKELEASRGAGESVFVDTTLVRELGLGGSATRSLRYLFMVRGIPRQRWQIAEEALPPSGSLVIVSAQTFRMLGSELPLRPTSGLRSPGVSDRFGLYRLTAVGGQAEREPGPSRVGRGIERQRESRAES